MAHECPVCGNHCFCNGDIGDLVTNFAPYINECMCCEEYDEYYNERFERDFDEEMEDG